MDTVAQKEKLRIVFNCSLLYKGLSLNDMLYPGPDLTSSLLGVLLSFRQEPIAFTSDIRKMFYQVRVPGEQRKYLKFFWFENSDLGGAIKEYWLTVHLFGATSSPSVCNYALQQTVKDENVNEEIRETVNRNFYVDDLLKSCESISGAVSTFKGVRKAVASGGFALTQFVSNSDEVVESLVRDKIAPDIKFVDLPGDNSNRVLAKRLFLETCSLKLDWNDDLPPELKQKWVNWLIDLPILGTYSVPRCLKFGTADSMQIYYFSDGSEIGYGAVAYGRFRDSCGNIYFSPIIAKGRLNPVSNSILKTIPRVELNGAKLSIILQQIIHKEIELIIDSEYF